MSILAGEKALVVSRVRIEKYDEDMNLVDVHESRVPEEEREVLPENPNIKDKK